MSKKRDARTRETEDADEHGDDQQSTDSNDDGSVVEITRKRGEVTTASILENFLLLATSLDDTVRDDILVKAMEAVGRPTLRASGAKVRKSNAVTMTPLQTRILHTLNLQRQEVRKNVYRAIQDFAVEYDAESARLGELNDAEYDYDPDEQVNLAKERWTLERATEKLKELEDQLKMDCVDLGRQVRRQEKDLTRLVDEIVEKREGSQQKRRQ